KLPGRAARARASHRTSPAHPRDGGAGSSPAPPRSRPRGGDGGLGRPGPRGPPLRLEAASPRPQHDPRGGGGGHPQRRAPAGPRPPAVIVMKFGGTSVGSAERMRGVAARVRERLSKRPVLVVSALGGVTDLLVRGARFALHRDPARETVLKDVVGRHEEV